MFSRTTCDNRLQLFDKVVVVVAVNSEPIAVASACID